MLTHFIVASLRENTMMLNVASLGLSQTGDNGPLLREEWSIVAIKDYFFSLELFFVIGCRHECCRTLLGRLLIYDRCSTHRDHLLRQEAGLFLLVYGFRVYLSQRLL